MIFSSLQYLIFLPLVVFLYWRTTGGTRLALVVLSSYFFYMSWFPIYGLLLLALTTVSWLLALALGRLRKPQDTGDPVRLDPESGLRITRRAKILLIAGLILNLGCLCYYNIRTFFSASFLIRSIC